MVALPFPVLGYARVFLHSPARPIEAVMINFCVFAHVFLIKNQSEKTVAPLTSHVVSPIYLSYTVCDAILFGYWCVDFGLDYTGVAGQLFVMDGVFLCKYGVSSLSPGKTCTNAPHPPGHHDCELREHATTTLGENPGWMMWSYWILQINGDSASAAR